MAEDYEKDKLSWSNVLYEYTQDTTLHGLRYVTPDSKSIIRRIFWALVLLAFSGFFIYIVVIRVIQFTVRDTTVSLQVVRNSSLDFPALTICNQNLIRRTKAYDSNLYDALVRKYTNVENSDKTGCSDKFLLYTSRDLVFLVPQVDMMSTYVGVTVDVCKKLCSSLENDLCNSVVYVYKTKSCRIMNPTAQSINVQVVIEEGVDYYERIRCPSPVDIVCSFDTDFGIFFVDSAGSDWIRYEGSTPTALSGPSADHTTSSGYYLLSAPMDKFESIIMSSLIVSGDTKRCMEFYYHMAGFDVGSLKIYIRDSERNTILIWQRFGYQGNGWKRGFVSIEQDVFNVLFISKGTAGQRKEIAIDDVQISTCETFYQDCVVGVKGVDYQGNTSQTEDGQQCISWIDIAQIVPINPYNFPDNNLQEAKHYCRNPGGYRDKPWCYTSLNADDWKYCNVGNCSNGRNEFDCGNSIYIPVSMLCDGIDHCGNGNDETTNCGMGVDCTFDSANMCGYETSTTDKDFQWQLGEADTRSLGTGPIYDANTRSTQGGYIYVESTYGKNGSLAVLKSPPTDFSGTGCLSFYVHMYGDNVGTFTVFVNSSSVLHQLYKISHNQGDKWIQKQLNINHWRWRLGQSVSFVFFATRGDGYKGDTALDDIQFKSEGCQEGCSSDMFQCDNGDCIPWVNVCDGQNDCGDLTDEYTQCASLGCTFDGPSSCGYTYEGWWSRPHSQPVIVVEDFNGTLFNSSGTGSYMLGVADDTVSSKLSSPWSKVQQPQCASFDYKKAMSILIVKIVYEDERTQEMMTLTGDRRDQWHRQYFDIQPDDREFQIMFEVVSTMLGDEVYLDNIIISPGYCTQELSIACTFDLVSICGYNTTYVGTDIIWSLYTGQALIETLYQDEYLTDRHTYDGDINKNDLVFGMEYALAGVATTGYLLSPWENITSASCLSIMYYSHGSLMHTIRVGLQYKNNFVQHLWNETVEEHRLWKTLQLNIPGGEYRLVITGVRGIALDNTLIIDNITMENGMCPFQCDSGMFKCENGHCILPSYTCDGENNCGDFSDERMCEKDYCKYTSSGTTHMGMTVNITKSGTECLPWNDVGLTSTDWLSFIFPDFTLDDNHNFCRNPNGSPGGPWCYVSGGLEWEYCDVPTCNCDSNRFECNNGKCVGRSMMCDGINNCGDRSDEMHSSCSPSMNCTFDTRNICGYEVIASERGYTWTRYSWDSPSKRTGPATDHTQGTKHGYYMLAEASYVPLLDKASLKSPLELVASQSCLTVHYHMTGNFMENIKFYMYDTDSLVKEFGMAQWDQGDMWLYHSYTMPPGEYGLLIVAVNGDDIAIDDISLAPGACDIPDECEFACANGKCVTVGSLCDGINDCGDGSDEISKCPHECKMTAAGEFYMGSVNTTFSGRHCDAWTNHKNELLENQWMWQFPDHTLQQAGNMCRNPDRKLHGPWCYVDQRGHWEYCNVTSCSGYAMCDPEFEFECESGGCVSRDVMCDTVDDCGDNSDEIECDGVRSLPPINSCMMTPTGENYKGSVNITKNGQECLTWNSVLVSNSIDFRESHNYCRNPDKSRDHPWCYHGLSEEEWDYCNIPLCDCSMDLLELNYMGTVHRTVTGELCQAWNTQFPHAHLNNQSHLFPEKNVNDANNYCRNPDKEPGGVWCYTTNTKLRWEYCHVPLCYELAAKEEKSECLKTYLGVEYSGTMSVTLSGKQCMNWTDTPYVDELTASDKNYCRNVGTGGSTVTPYCYTEDDWEYCRIPYCPGTLVTYGIDCTFDTNYMCGYKATQIAGHHWLRRGTLNNRYSVSFLDVLLSKHDICYDSENRGSLYMGTVSKTEDGITCQRWNTKFPHIQSQTDFPDKSVMDANNYCRNPDGSLRPWCYTVDPEVRWKECDIPKCLESVILALPSGDEGDEAYLSSPFIETGPGMDAFCVTFNYLLYGSGAGQLRLHINFTNGHMKQTWEVFGDQGLLWHTVNVTVNKPPSDFQLVFVSKQGYSDIAPALDEVSVSTGKCASLRECVIPEEVECGNGLCIPATKKCDGFNDCLDFTDETHCNGCSPSQFRCAMGLCISAALVMDGNTNCPDGSDEFEEIFLTYLALEETGGDDEGGNITDISMIPSDEDLHPLILQMTGKVFHQFLQDSSNALSDFIFGCTWLGETCDSNDFIQMITDFGVCYTFNYNTTDLENRDETETKVVNGTGSGTALRLKIDIEDYDSMLGQHPHAGVKLYVHSRNAIPFVNDFGFTLAPGMEYLVQLEPTMVSDMGPPWGECGSSDLQYYESYDLERCTRECEINMTLRMCSCLAPYMGVAVGEPSPQYCSFNEYYNCFVFNQDSIRQNGATCDCLTECNRQTYGSEFSFASLNENIIPNLVSSDLQNRMARALDVADKSDYDSYVSQLDILRNITESIQSMINKLNLLVTGDQSLLHILYNVVDLFTTMMKDNTVQVSEDMIRHEARNLLPLSNLRKYYLDIKNTLISKCYIVFKYSSIYNISTNAAFTRNGVDIKYLLNEYQETLTLYYTSSENNDTTCAQYLQDISQHIQNIIIEDEIKFEYPDLIEIMSFDDVCFGEEYLGLENVYKTFWNLHDHNIRDVNLLLKRLLISFEYNLMELVFPLEQLKADLQQAIRETKSGTINKLQAMDKISLLFQTKGIPGMNIFMSSTDTSFIEEWQTVIGNISRVIENEYLLVLESVLEISEYSSISYFQNGIKGLLIWRRPLVTIGKGTLQVIYHTEIEDIYGSAGDDITIPVNYRQILSYHISSYFEDVHYALKSWKRQFFKKGYQFQAEVDYFHEIYKTFLSKTKVDETFVRQNIMYVDLYFSKLDIQVIKQQKAYDLEGLLGDIGGFMGLLLGGSAMTLIEVLDLFIFNCIRKLTHSQKQVKHHPEIGVNKISNIY